MPTVPLIVRGFVERRIAMGFLDWVTGKIRCPQCGTSGARETEGRILCPNPSCAYFDASGGQGGSVPQAETKSPGSGSFTPARATTFLYKNHQGQEQTFTADAETAVRKGNHILMRVAPSGLQISLSRDRIQNLREVEGAFPQRVEPGQTWPTPRERQILGYHKKNKSSSPLYEKIRSKYPQW